MKGCRLVQWKRSASARSRRMRSAANLKLSSGIYRLRGLKVRANSVVGRSVRCGLRPRLADVLGNQSAIPHPMMGCVDPLIAIGGTELVIAACGNRAVRVRLLELRTHPGIAV